jgi:iron complex outermembrane receptor protein
MYLCFQVKRLKNIFALNFHSVPKYNFMKQCIFTLLFVINACFSYAQSPAKVSGKITTNNKPLASATVSLFHAKDSLLAKTAVTNSTGDFKITGVKPGSYFLSATSVGHTKNSSAGFNIAEGQEFTAPSLNLLQSATSLSEVTVKAKKPMIEVRADKTVFNVENSINAT